MKKIIFTEEQTTNILELYQGGWSIKQISRKLKLSEWAIKQEIKELDVERPYKYIGKKFGRLTVLERAGTYKNGSPIVRCLCDCGTITLNIITNLTAKTTMSCGCYNKEITASKNPWLTEYNAYIGNTVKKRGLSFQLNVEEFQKLCSSTCFYCGSEPATKMDVGKGVKNGIDRVDPNIGYELTNCVTCCWNCNRMKSNMSHDDFITHIGKIYKRILLKQMVQGIGFEPISDQSERSILPLDEP